MSLRAHAASVRAGRRSTRPDCHFSGNVGRAYLDSGPAQFPQPVKAPKGAPNIVLILLDDVGFGQSARLAPTRSGSSPAPSGR
jgi:arylsulfatase